MRKLEGKPEYHVLIADDEPGIRSFLREWVDENVPEALPGKYIVYEAGDGNEAMARAAECQASGHSLDLAIIDLMMPGKNGFETIDELLTASPSTPIVTFSATGSFYHERLAGYGGRVTMMEKPVRLAPFVKTVTDILSGDGR